MTFTEAALEVLRSAGKPLHYKKITEIAIEKSLLSHVGKTPEMTMSSRLATLVKKSRGNSPIVKVRPGVFAVRKTGNQTEESPATQGEEENQSKTEGDHSPGRVSLDSESQLSGPAVVPPGADLFPEEEGDDDPIFSDAPPSSATASSQDQSPRDDAKSRRRRRRRRRTKGDGDEEPFTEEAPSRPNGRERAPFRAGERNAGERSAGERNAGRKYAAHANSLDWNRQPADGDLLGKNLADAVRAVLLRYERHPVTFSRAAELLVGRGRLSGSASALAPTIAAAVRADVSRSEVAGSRPRFRVRGNHLGLTDWLLSKEALRAEEAVMRSAQRQREQIRQTLIDKLNSLPTASFAELVATWLNAEGVVSLRAVRRPGSSAAQLHLAGTLRRGVEETRLAIIVRRDGKPIDRDSVVSARGALHHYGNATSAWLATTGRVASAAWEEAATGGAAPCALLDGMALATAMERVGVGVRQHSIPITCPDFDLFEALGDKGEVRDRDDRERDRDRERGRRGRRTRGREESPADEPRAKRGDRAPREEPEESEPKPDALAEDEERPALEAVEAVEEEGGVEAGSLDASALREQDVEEHDQEVEGDDQDEASESAQASAESDAQDSTADDSHDEPDDAGVDSQADIDSQAQAGLESVEVNEPTRGEELAAADAQEEPSPEASEPGEESQELVDAEPLPDGNQNGADEAAAEFDVDDSAFAARAPSGPRSLGKAATAETLETDGEGEAESDDDDDAR